MLRFVIAAPVTDGAALTEWRIVAEEAATRRRKA
jgi:hypothetical protein